MRLLFTLFISIFFTTTFSLKNEEIPLTIHFNYSKNINFEKGTITIKETKQIFEITSLQDLIIPLKKGKYTIIFSAENFGKVWISKKINDKNYTFNLAVRENANVAIQSPISEELVLNQVEKGTANFINFGLGMQDFSAFNKKYGIGNLNQGCVISGNIGSDATKNNQLIAKYLDKKYGEIWRKDVPFLPFGLK